MSLVVVQTSCLARHGHFAVDAFCFTLQSSAAIERLDLHVPDHASTLHQISALQNSTALFHTPLLLHPANPDTHPAFTSSAHHPSHHSRSPYPSCPQSSAAADPDARPSPTDWGLVLAASRLWGHRLRSRSLVMRDASGRRLCVGFGCCGGGRIGEVGL